MLTANNGRLNVKLIRHFRKYHNYLFAPPPPPPQKKEKKCITIVAKIFAVGVGGGGTKR